VPRDQLAPSPVSVLTRAEGVGLTDMSWEHAAEARAALNAIVTDPQHGVAALSSGQTMSHLLKELLPDAPREKSILVAAAEAGLANTVRQYVDHGMDPNTAIRLAAASLSSTTPFTPEACTWVANEIANALGVRYGGRWPLGRAPLGGGPPAEGPLAGTPPGFDAGRQGMPTQAAPYGQAGGYSQPGYGQPGYGQPGSGQPEGGGWQGGGYGEGPGTPGGYGQPGGYGEAGGGYGDAGGGYGQAGGGWQHGDYGQGPGQPGGGWQDGGYGQGPGQPGAYGIQQPGWYGPAVQPGPMGPTGPMGPIGPIIPAGPGGPVKPRGGRRGWLIGGGIAAVVAVAVVVAGSLSGGASPKQPAHTPTSPASPRSTPANPTPEPSLIHPRGTDALATIMNPTGAGQKPVGTDCITAKLFGLNPGTLDARVFCQHTTTANIVVWGYQFDNSAEYQAGLAHINHYVGFDRATPGSACPPRSGSKEGKVRWRTINNPKYHPFRQGQDIECLIDGKKPVLIWTMPTQDAFFIGQDNVKGTKIKTVISWWRTLIYGP
jgi:hypothetical protein